MHRYTRTALAILAALIATTTLMVPARAENPTGKGGKPDKSTDTEPDPCLDIVWGHGHLIRQTKGSRNEVNEVNEIAVSVIVEMAQGCLLPDPDRYRLRITLLDGRQIELSPSGTHQALSEDQDEDLSAWFATFDLALGSETITSATTLPLGLGPTETERVTTGYTGTSVSAQVVTRDSQGTVVDLAPDDPTKLCLLPDNEDDDCGSGGGGTYWR
jgi:hypothetical protein